MQAVILAGGRGTRLLPLTNTVPKPMVMVRGRPFLEYFVVLLKRNNITDILMLTGYLGEVIEEHFGDGSAYGVRISYSRESNPLGVVGALQLAYPKLADSFLLLYGDSIVSIDYQELIRFYEASRKRAVATVYKYKDEQDRGDDYPHNICVDEKGFITHYEQKGMSNATHTEGGALALKKNIIDDLPQIYTNALGSLLFPRLIKDREIVAYISKNRFYDIGTLERLKRAEECFRNFQNIDGT